MKEFNGNNLNRAYGRAACYVLIGDSLFWFIKYESIDDGFVLESIIPGPSNPGKGDISILAKNTPVNSLVFADWTDEDTGLRKDAYIITESNTIESQDDFTTVRITIKNV